MFSVLVFQPSHSGYSGSRASMNILQLLMLLVLVLIQVRVDQYALVHRPKMVLLAQAYVDVKKNTPLQAAPTDRRGKMEASFKMLRSIQIARSIKVSHELPAPLVAAHA
jgi:hypothetical protein